MVGRSSCCCMRPSGYVRVLITCTCGWQHSGISAAYCPPQERSPKPCCNSYACTPHKIILCSAKNRMRSNRTWSRTAKKNQKMLITGGVPITLRVLTMETCLRVHNQERHITHTYKDTAHSTSIFDRHLPLHSSFAFSSLSHPKPQTRCST